MLFLLLGFIHIIVPFIVLTFAAKGVICTFGACTHSRRRMTPTPEDCTLHSCCQLPQELGEVLCQATEALATINLKDYVDIKDAASDIPAGRELKWNQTIFDDLDLFLSPDTPRAAYMTYGNLVLESYLIRVKLEDGSMLSVTSLNRDGKMEILEEVPAAEAAQIYRVVNGLCNFHRHLMEKKLKDALSGLEADKTVEAQDSTFTVKRDV